MKNNLNILLMLLSMLFVLTVSVSAADLPLVYDEADLLTDMEESALIAELESISDDADMDVVVALVDSIGELSPMEYADDFFKEREFMSGFTGSNGNLLVGANMVGLWTDGRYFVQAERQLAGTIVTLFKMAVTNLNRRNFFLHQTDFAFFFLYHHKELYVNLT